MLSTLSWILNYINLHYRFCTHHTYSNDQNVRSSPQFTGLSVTSGVDQMLALHTSSQDDVLLCLQRGELCPNQDRVGELVGTLVDHFTRSVSCSYTTRRSARKHFFQLQVQFFKKLLLNILTQNAFSDNSYKIIIWLFEFIFQLSSITRTSGYFYNQVDKHLHTLFKAKNH